MEMLEHKAFANMARAGGLSGVTVAAHGRSWSVVAQVRKTLFTVKAQRGGPREFAKIDSAGKYLSSVGIKHFEVDYSGFDEAAISDRSRPDAAEHLRQAHEAAQLLRTIDERVKMADDPGTQWVSNDDVSGYLKKWAAGERPSAPAS